MIFITTQQKLIQYKQQSNNVTMKKINGTYHVIKTGTNMRIYWDVLLLFLPGGYYFDEIIRTDVK